MCAQLDLSSEIGLALSRATRGRELALGVPAVLAGCVIQARRLSATAGWPGAPPSA